jgi:hypothetical protein
MRSRDSRRLEQLMHALFADDVLRHEGITLFTGHVDRSRRCVEIEVAAADAERASGVIRQRHGDRIDVRVVASSPYVHKDLPWDDWAQEGERHLSVWLIDYTDGARLRASCEETDEEAVVTVGEPRWVGPHHEPALLVRKDVRLGRPLAGRRVVDGVSGETRPRRR